MDHDFNSVPDVDRETKDRKNEFARLRRAAKAVAHFVMLTLRFLSDLFCVCFL